MRQKCNSLDRTASSMSCQKTGTVCHLCKTVPTVKHSGGCIMLWGCYSAARIERMVTSDKRWMNATKYRNILEENLLLQIAYNLRLGWFTIQHNTDHKLTAKTTQVCNLIRLQSYHTSVERHEDSSRTLDIHKGSAMKKFPKTGVRCIYKVLKKGSEHFMIEQFQVFD